MVVSSSTDAESASIATTMPTLVGYAHSKCHVSSSLRVSSDLESSKSPTPSLIDCHVDHAISEKNVDPAGLTLKGDSKQLSTARLLIIHVALGLALFLATTDVHLVATSLPTISADLGGNSSLYTWVGVAYVLPQTVFQPLIGKIADIVGRKPVLYFSIFLFLLGSLLCGFAQTMMWLVIARGASGAGAGGLVSMVWLIAGEIVPIEEKNKWGNMLSFVWAASALAGPLLGGIFSQLVSWRWGFFVNVPICVIAVILLLIFLREDRTRDLDGASRKQYLLDLNWLGLALLVFGTTTLLLGFSSASSSGWHGPRTITLVTVGSVGLIAGCAQDYFYSNALKNGRLIPRALFTLSGSILSIGSFFQAFTFTAATFYLALFFQAVTGASAIQAGLYLLPFSLGSAVISLVANWYMGIGQPKHLVILGLGVASLGFGLMIMLNEKSTRFLQLFLPLIAGLGMGLLFKSPFNALEKTVQPRDRAAMTGCFFYVRFIGTSVGLSLAGAIFDTRVQATAPSGFVFNPNSMDWRTLVHISDETLRMEVLSCVAKAVSLIWVMCAPLLGLSCILSFLIATGSTATKQVDVEKQSDASSQGSRGSISEEKNGASPAPTIVASSTSTSTTTLPLPVDDVEKRSEDVTTLKAYANQDLPSQVEIIA